MKGANLRSVDLNLLLALEALLEERNVTRAAERIHLSQPAMSRALGRLRDVFSDPILVRSGREFLPTPRAVRLQQDLYKVLGSIRHLVGDPGVRPEQLEGHIRFSAPDGAIVSFLGKVIRSIMLRAPNIEFTLLHQTEGDLDDLRHGKLDIALGFYPSIPRDLLWTSLAIHDEFSCLVRKGHPILKGEMSRREYLSATHIDVISPVGQTIDKRLEIKKIKRKVSMRVSSFVSGAAIASETDWILTAPKIFALYAPRIFPVRRVDLPVSLRAIQDVQVELFMVWHQRCDSDPLQQWLRSALISQVSEELRVAMSQLAVN